MKRNILLCILVIFAATSCNDLKQDGLTDPQEIVQNLKSPTNLHIRVEDENVLQLSWEDNCKIEENFHIYRRKGSEDYTLYKTLPANTTQWQDNDVILGNSYSYRIFAIKGKYSSESYAESSFLYKLFAPSNLIVEAVTDSRIKLSWDDTNHFEEGYKIDRKRGGSAWEENFATVPTNISYWEHTLDGSEGSIVIWRVKAYYKSLQGENSTESSITVAEPVFSPSGGTYTSAQNVTISCATNGATIRYTTDGSTPSNSSTIYSGAVLINQSTTLKAKAFKSGWMESDTSEASYNLKVASPTFYPAGGTYSSPQSVTINCATSGNVIRYTTDGSVPNSSSAQYSSAIQVSSKTTIKAKAFKSGWMESDASEASYNLKVASPTFNPAGGTYSSPQSVTINCATSGATIRYTTDGSVPNSSSALYSSAIQVSSDTTIKAIAFKSGWADADVATSSYSIQLSVVATPFFSIAGGTYYLPQNVSIGCATSGATIRYTTDGSTPTSSSTIYSSAISINGSTTLKAKAFKQGSQDSDTASASYNMKVYNPTFSPGGGSYSSAQSVSISCATAGAQIRYTTNGTNPTESSALYSSPILVESTTTITAKAFKSGWTASNVIAKQYIITGIDIGFADNFESYPDFTTTFSPWTLHDVDGSTTYGFTGIEFPGNYAAMSYIIFNPSATTPALDHDAHSGNKFAACFASGTPPNNDWMITPSIPGGGTLKFWAKTFMDYGLERLKIGVSTSGTQPANFSFIQSGQYLEVPLDWTLYTYDLSAYAGQNIRIGFNCVSNDCFILWIDDVEITGPVSSKTKQETFVKTDSSSSNSQSPKNNPNNHLYHKKK